MFNIHLSIERWKWNADFGIYVSNKGRFRSRDKRDLPVKIGAKGYCFVYCEGTVHKYRRAHRVVLLTWRPTDDAENLTVDHLDHNKRNNSVENLEWVTYEENIRRANRDLLSSEECELEEKPVTKPPLALGKLLYPKTKEELKEYKRILSTVTHYHISPYDLQAKQKCSEFVFDYSKCDTNELVREFGQLKDFNPSLIIMGIANMRNGSNKKGKYERYGLRVTPILN